MTNDFDIKQAFDRELDGLEPMPDAVPGTVIAGRRRPGAAGVAALGGLMVSAGLAVAAVAVLQPGPETQVAGPGIGPPPQAVPSTPSTPGAGQSAKPGKYTGPPDAFRKQIATELSTVLPDRFGPVTAVIPQTATSNGYRVTAGGKTFAITFNLVKPMPGQPSTTCGPQGPGSPVASCATRLLPDGGRAMSDHQPDSRTKKSTVTLTALIRGRSVSLYFFADKSAEPPLSDQEMLDVAAEPRFSALIQSWASHPEWVPDESNPDPRSILTHLPTAGN